MFLFKNKCAVISVFSILIIIATVSLVTVYQISHHKVHARKRVIPMVMNTWDFKRATASAWEIIKSTKSAVNAVHEGCLICEIDQCKHTVGMGGSPDENGETTLDALIIDGATMNVGAVGGLRSIKSAISVARKVMDQTKHTLLAGDLATQFALNLGFVPESLLTDYSYGLWKSWRDNKCQPNFWNNVSPNHTQTCGPYYISEGLEDATEDEYGSSTNHDTITVLAIDEAGNIAAGGSTNGLIHKIPGRVGDTPIPGAGAYADNEVGAASATGNGDIMMRYLPSFLAVEMMRMGMSPKQAAETAIKRISSRHPRFFGAVIAVNIYGDFGAACNGMETFPFCVANEELGVKNFSIPCNI
ncbi:N(4)-(Beta-N-acetylglucosaminyl)-L-asparaginase [Nilaparvata lugens]|uniref:N(4)-(Beta-N-acetylglucosaminyl)-L-asparaginase n=1 Tax=Nilaparvata lugens TaxID=108931 RepID=UPI00193D64DA|nr:N(4)-(Beta-N-acetylglucosaminyl)-L-asparaginase [Nilaparvata lugens]